MQYIMQCIKSIYTINKKERSLYTKEKKPSKHIKPGNNNDAELSIL